MLAIYHQIPLYVFQQSIACDIRRTNNHFYTIFQFENIAFRMETIGKIVLLIVETFIVQMTLKIRMLRQTQKVV